MSDLTRILVVDDDRQVLRYLTELSVLTTNRRFCLPRRSRPSTLLGTTKAGRCQSSTDPDHRLIRIAD
jgi:hypothetical protein